MENELLKKAVEYTAQRRKRAFLTDHRKSLAVSKGDCEVMGLGRSTYYYRVRQSSFSVGWYSTPF